MQRPCASSSAFEATLPCWIPTNGTKIHMLSRAFSPPTRTTEVARVRGHADDRVTCNGCRTGRLRWRPTAARHRAATDHISPPAGIREATTRRSRVSRVSMSLRSALLPEQELRLTRWGATLLGSNWPIATLHSPRRLRGLGFNDSWRRGDPLGRRRRLRARPGRREGDPGRQAEERRGEELLSYVVKS